MFEVKFMGHPVTTNPFIIMLINMTVVFIVLVVLMYVIKLIHYVDPTKPKEQPVAETAPAKEATPAPVKEEEIPVGIPDEVIAAIAAALAAMGTSGEIRAVRPVDRQGWKVSGRMNAFNRG